VRKKLTEGRVSIFVKPSFLPRLRKDFAVDQLPRRPIGFRLPPAGRIEVRVLDARGEAVSGAIPVRLGMISPHELADPTRAFERRSSTKTTSGGVALFEAVPPGRRFEVVAFQGFAEVEAAFPGPTHAGESVTIELAFGRDQPILGLRALDETAQPLANVQIKVSSAGEDPLSRRMWTGADGSLRLFLDATALDGVDLRFETQRKDGIPLTATRSFGSLVTGLIDGGEVVFQPHELLASGLVLDDQGLPVTNGLIFVNGSKNRADRTGAQGRFHIWREGFEGERLILVAAKNGSRSAELEVARGSKDLVLVLRATGSLRGLLTYNGVRVHGLEVELSREDGAGTVQRKGESNRWFSFRHLQVGAYRLRVLLFEEILAEVGGLLIQPGEALLDPRLGPLDLRGRLVLHHIEYENQGKRVAGTLRYGPAGSQPSSAWRTVSLGLRENWLASVSDAIDIELHPTNHLSQRIENVQGHALVTLGRMRAVVWLRVSSDTPLPGLPLLLQASLSQGGHSVTRSGALTVTAGDPEVRLLVNATGPCEVSWTLQRLFAGSQRTAGVDLGPPIVIDVRDVSEEQVFDVVIPADALRELLAKPPF